MLRMGIDMTREFALQYPRYLRVRWWWTENAAAWCSGPGVPIDGPAPCAATWEEWSSCP